MKNKYEGQELSLEEIQRRLLDMATIIKIILEKHKIRYMITFGSLLGAVRHGGFIPWDDDFDFFLFDDEYEKAIRILREELPTDLFLEDGLSEPLYFHSWAHIKDLNTNAICEQFPQDNIYNHKGLSIDLYEAFLMDERDVDLFRLNENLKYREREFQSKVISKQQFELFKEDLLSKIRAEKAKISNMPAKGNVYGLVVNERVMYLQDIFPLKAYQFESISFMGPNDADSMLKKFYGDYMIMPPLEMRHPHYNKVYVVNKE